MTGNFLGYYRKFIIGLLIMGFGCTLIQAQTSLSGYLNQPHTHVVTIGADRVTVNDVTGFAVNDTILLIQMQGVEILTALNAYGTLQSKLGEPGMHEFMIIMSINTGTNEIVFRNNILSTYDPRGNCQIIRVPYYNSAVVTGKLSCAPWDTLSKSGGVLALIVGRTLTLNADIDVSESGFRGGKDTIGDGICRSTDQTLYGQEYYSRTFTNAGFKGEGVANMSEYGQPLGKSFMKGLGNNWTGGGGGNGRYSGGGGGSNRNSGGLGGFEDCSTPFPGGNYGVIADHTSLPDRIYMGGGGGASTTSPAAISSNGGNGGGIVIIVADALAGNGGNILANGGNGGSVTGAGGSGGGGAGGSISLSLNNYGSNPLSFSVDGGNGGDNPGNYGEGGGGSGGLVYLRTDISSNVTISGKGGAPGNDATSTATGGGQGQKRLGFNAVLNGFLFNTISSSVTDTQTDTVCSNMIPPGIIGTQPVGGTPGYTYLWEKSYDNANWVTLTNDPDPVNFTPQAPEAQTVWYRRTITDASVPVLVDISKPVEIFVQPYIKNNIVGTSDTICYAQNPPVFTSKALLQDGNGTYTFNWEVSLNNSLYVTPLNAHNSEEYTPPPALIVTSWYRRTVNSGRCIDSSAIVKITVLDTIRNNRVLNSPSDICYGMSFANLAGTTNATTPSLSGGDNAFRYLWESNINGSGWGPATVINTGPDYDPVELPQRTPSNQYLFRRRVFSGSNNVCASVSNAVLFYDYPVIINNTVTPVSTICSGSAPSNLVGSKSPLLAGGNTVFTYTWQDSLKTHTWQVIPGASGMDYQPPVLTDTTSYRRIVTSSVCSDISTPVQIWVNKPVINNNISISAGNVALTICNNQLPGSLQGTIPTGGTDIPGDYAYQWKYSADNSVFTDIPSVGTSANYTPPSLSATTYYRRDVMSGACTGLSNIVAVTVLPDISNNNISGTSGVCYSFVPDVVAGAAPLNGSGSYNYIWQQSTDGGTNWNSAPGANSSQDYQPPALTAPASYRRIVTSGPNDCCISTSNVFDIAIYTLPSINAGPDTTIYSVGKLYHMIAGEPGANESGIWDVLNSGSGTGAFDNKSFFNTIVRDLVPGTNSYLWTVSNEHCTLMDTVNIVLLEDFVPQGFSPNGDGINDDFIVEGLNQDDYLMTLKIIDGAGTEVFSTSNQDPGGWENWNGKNSGGIDLPEGTYYYLLKVAMKSTGQVIKKESRFIVLKRY